MNLIEVLVFLILWVISCYVSFKLGIIYQTYVNLLTEISRRLKEMEEESEEDCEEDDSEEQNDSELEELRNELNQQGQKIQALQEQYRNLDQQVYENDHWIGDLYKAINSIQENLDKFQQIVLQNQQANMMNVSELNGIDQQIGFLNQERLRIWNEINNLLNDLNNPPVNEEDYEEIYEAEEEDDEEDDDRMYTPPPNWGNPEAQTIYDIPFVIDDEDNHFPLTSTPNNSGGLMEIG